MTTNRTNLWISILLGTVVPTITTIIIFAVFPKILRGPAEAIYAKCVDDKIPSRTCEDLARSSEKARIAVELAKTNLEIAQKEAYLAYLSTLTQGQKPVTFEEYKAALLKRIQ